MKSNMIIRSHGFEGGDKVMVFIGPQKKLYIIPNEFLCSNSEYFRAMFESNFIEGQEQSCHFEDAEPCTFDLLLQWCGTQRIVPREFGAVMDCAKFSAKRKGTARSLCVLGSNRYTNVTSP